MPTIAELLQKAESNWATLAPGNTRPVRKPQAPSDGPGALWWCSDSFYFRAHEERPVLLFQRSADKCVQIPGGHCKRGDSVRVDLPMLSGPWRQTWLRMRERRQYSFPQFCAHRRRFITVLDGKSMQRVIAAARNARRFR